MHVGDSSEYCLHVLHRCHEGVDGTAAQGASRLAIRAGEAEQACRDATRNSGVDMCYAKP
jgi:hypothetical protein